MNTELNVRDLTALGLGALLAAALFSMLMTVAPASGCAVSAGPVALPYFSIQALGPVE